MNPKLPSVGHSQIEHEGLALLKQRVVAPTSDGGLDFIFRELPAMDFGIDAQIEVVAGTMSNKVATGKFLSVQVKTGKSYFENDDGITWSVYIAKSTVNYWRAHSVPVILALVDLETKNIYWTRGDSVSHEETQNNYRIRVSKLSRLDSSARNELAELAEHTTEEGRRLARLESELPIIADLVKGNPVMMDIMHWHNKSSGRIDYWIGPPGDNPTRDGPRDLVPVLSGTVIGTGGDVLAATRFVAPWADASRDEDFEEEAEQTLYDEYLAEHGTWDSEDHVYVDSTGTFETWMERRRQMQEENFPLAYEIDGEVTQYRVKLLPNDLARSYVTLREYLTNAANRDA